MSPTADWIPAVQPPVRVSINDRWNAHLITGKRGAALGNVANALTALRYAPEWQGVLYFNENSFAIVAKVSPPFEYARRVPFQWDDEHDVQTAAWLQHQGLSVSKEIAGQAVQVAAREHPFHPIRDYLDSLLWDEIPRLDNWLTRYLGSEPSDYIRAVGAKWLISGVARVYKPGCKVDTCPIFEGGQGALKSTALRTLAGDDFFSDDIAELGSKDSVMQTRGVWIIELAELDSMSRGEVSQVKAFVSRQVDNIRPPYGRRPIKTPRECVFAGTTNKQDYLKDETGGRRWWPVLCGRINIDELRRDRDQLWSEAVIRFRAGDAWWLDSMDLVQAAAAEQRDRYEGDPWDEKIARFVASCDSVSIPNILELCIEKPKEDWIRADDMRISRILKSEGWVRFRTAADDRGKREWKYRRGPNLRNLSQ